MIISRCIPSSRINFGESHILIDSSILLCKKAKEVLDLVKAYINASHDKIIYIPREEIETYYFLVNYSKSNALSSDDKKTISNAKSCIQKLIRTFSPNRLIQSTSSPTDIIRACSEAICLITANEVSLLRVLDQFGPSDALYCVLCTDSNFYNFSARQMHETLSSSSRSYSNSPSYDLHFDKNTPWYCYHGSSLKRTIKRPVLIKSNGMEGEIYRLSPGILGKVFKRSITSERIEKIALLSSLSLGEYIISPREILCGSKGTTDPICYTMTDVSNYRSIYDLIPNTTTEYLQKYYPGCDRGTLIRLTIDLVAKVLLLHHKGIMPCDYSPSNFLVNTRNDTFIFIDTDSYYVGIYPNNAKASVVFPYSIDFSKPIHAAAAEYSSLLVLVFNILTLESKPFYNSLDNQSSVFKFMSTSDTNSEKPFPHQEFWDILPFYMQNLFSKTFNNSDSCPYINYHASPLDILHCLRLYLHDWDHKKLSDSQRKLIP